MQRTHALLLLLLPTLAVSPAARSEPPPQQKQPVRLDRYGDPLPEGAIARLGTIRFRAEGHVSSVSLSLDGRLVAAGDSERQVTLWEAATGKFVRRLDAGARWPRLVFSPDSTRLLTKNGDGDTQIWEVATGKRLTSFHRSPPSRRQSEILFFTSDANHIIAVPDVNDRIAVRNGKHQDAYIVGKKLPELAVELLEAATGKVLKQLVRNDKETVFSDAALSPDGKLLAIGLRVYNAPRRHVQLIEVATGKLVREFRLEGKEWILSVAFAPDGKTLALGSRDEIVIADVNRGKQIGKLTANMSTVAFLAFTPDGKTLLSHGHDNKVRIWDVVDRKERLAFAAEAAGHRVSPLPTGLRRPEHDEFFGKADKTALSPDGGTVVVGTEMSVRLWDVGAGKELFTEFADLGYWTRLHGFSPNGRLLIGGDLEQARLWDCANGKVLWQFPVGPNAAAFSPDAGQIALAPRSKANERDVRAVGIWDVATRKEIRQLNHPPAAGFTFEALAAGDLAGAPVDPDTGANRLGGSPRRNQVPCQGCSRSPPDAGSESVIGAAGETARRQAMSFSLDATGAALYAASSVFDSLVHVLPKLREAFMCLPRGRFFAIMLLTLAALLPARSYPPAEKKPPVRLDRYGDPLPEGAIARLGTLRLRQIGPVLCLAFSPDGKTLASAGRYGIVYLWEVPTGKAIRQLKGHQPGIWSVAFSPNGNAVASAGMDGTVRLWDVTTGMEVRQFVGQQRPVTSVAFSPDGKMLAGASQDRTIRLWEVDTARELRQFQGHEGEVRSVAFSGDGLKLASGGRDKTVRLWEVATGKELRKIAAHEGDVECVAVAATGKTVASASRDKTIRLWDTSTGKELRQFAAHPEGGRSVVFSSDGKVMASASSDSTVSVWEVATRKELRRLAGGPGKALVVAISPDGKVLASASCDNTQLYFDESIRLWEVATGKELLPQTGHRCWISSLAFSKDGKTLATGSWDKTVRLWDLATAKEYGRFEGPEDTVNSVKISPDGTILAAGCSDKTVRLWDLTTRKELRQLRGHKNWVEAVAFFPDGKMLASVGADQTIRFWEIATGKEAVRIQDSVGNGVGVHRVAVAPDGKTVASAHSDGTVRLWEATGKPTLLLKGAGDQVYCVAFSPDGRELAVRGEDPTTIDLVDVATGAKLHQFQGHDAIVILWVTFSPDGKTLASGSRDGTVRLWEVATSKERARFAGHQSDVWTVFFSPDGKALASGSQDSTVVVWDVTGRIRAGRPELVKLTPKELEAGWQDLADDDAAKAYQAIWVLAAAPGQTLPILKKRLQPLPAVNPQQQKQLAKSIADLDSDEFAVREQATQELEKLGEAAVPALRKTLAGQPSLEVQTRVKQLLQKLEGPGMSGERLRTLRAVELLENIGTPEARDALKSLAKGAPEARLTQDAKASLERLAKRAPNQR